MTVGGEHAPSPRRAVVRARWPAPLSAACATAVMAAAASRPWGLGALALVAYAPTFVVLTRVERPLHGAVLAATASLGLGSVAYEAAQGVFPAGHVVATLLAAVPYLPVGGLAVRLRLTLARRLPPASAAALTLLALPSVWSAAEWLPSRPELLGAFALPLGFIGYSQVDLPTAKVASFGSVAAVSHLVLLVNAGVAAGLLASAAVARRRSGAGAVATGHGSGAASSPSNRRLTGSRAYQVRRCGRAALWVAAVLVLTPALAGEQPSAGSGSVELGLAGLPPGAGPVVAETVGVPMAASPSSPRLVVELLQPDLPDAAYFAASRLPGARGWLVGRLAASASGDADLTVLPEAAWPGALDADDLAAVAAELSAAFGDSATLLLGAPAVGFAGGRALTNSAFLFDRGEVTHVYAKRRLVPVAESRFVAGDGPAVVTVAGVPFAVFVCYDALFPGDARAAAMAGARLLVVITDDAFAAGSDVPELHLRAARFRAMETGVPLVLAANTGPSAVVEPSGRVVARLPALQAGALRAEVVPGEGATAYLALGDWLGALNAIFTGGLAAALSRGGFSHKGPA